MKLNYLPIFAILLIGVVLISGCVQQQTSTPDTQKISQNEPTTPPENVEQVQTPPSETSQIQTPPKTVKKEANIEIISTYPYVDSLGYPTVVGEVKNTGEANANYVQLIVTFYDAEKNVIGSSFSYTDVDIIRPNEKSPFSVKLLEKVTFDTAKTQAQWSTTSSEPYDYFEILSKRGYVDQLGYYKVTGEVKNTGDQQRGYVKVIGTFYDSNGKAIATAFTYTDIDTLAPGVTSPFSLAVLDKDISASIDNYVLKVES